MRGEIKYTLYRIGIDDSSMDEANVIEGFSMNALNRLPIRMKREMIELFRIMAEQIETGIYNAEMKSKQVTAEDV